MSIAAINLEAIAHHLEKYGETQLDPQAVAKQLRSAAETLRLAEKVWSECNVVYHPTDGTYPIEHYAYAGKELRAEIEAELAKK
jgi:hypothetical protein